MYDLAFNMNVIFLESHDKCDLTDLNTGRLNLRASVQPLLYHDLMSNLVVASQQNKAKNDDLMQFVHANTGK